MKIEMNSELSQKAVDKTIEGLIDVFKIQKDKGHDIFSTYIGLTELAKSMPESMALFTSLGLAIVGEKLEDEDLMDPTEFKKQLLVESNQSDE